MKVEKINNDKVKITLTYQELKEKKITLNDIKNSKEKAQDFFLELLEEANLLEDFEKDSNELFIEASKEDNLLNVTITKMSNLDSADIIPKENILYKISSNIYTFKNLESIKEFSNMANILNLSLPESILYYFNNKFFLVFKKKGVNASSFIKTFSILSEYAEACDSSCSFNDILTEYGTLLFKSTSINNMHNQILENPYFLT